MTQTTPLADDRFASVDAYMRRTRYRQDQLIQTLHVAQDVFGCLSAGVIEHVARALLLPPSAVYGVATFYHLFHFDPPGEHVCTVCTGTACFVKGADDIVSALSARFGVPAGETTADGQFTLGTARCLGSCGLAPVSVIDGTVLGHHDVSAVLAAVEAALGDGEPPGSPPGVPPGSPEAAAVKGVS